METLSQLLAKMSVFSMAHNLTNGHPTEKDYIQPFTVMAEEHPPSPSRGGDTRAFRRLRVKPAMTVSRGDCSHKVLVLKSLKTNRYATNR